MLSQATKLGPIIVDNCLRRAAVHTIKRLLGFIYPAHATKMAKFDQILAFFGQIGPKICLSGPFWCYVRPKSDGNKVPFWSPGMLSWAHIGLAGSFGALLFSWLMVVARGLYLARHLFTLFSSLSYQRND